VNVGHVNPDDPAHDPGVSRAVVLLEVTATAVR